MGLDKNFRPTLRFFVVSDVHYKDEHTVERDRMEKAIKTVYALSDGEDYSKVDALYVVGDFANSGKVTKTPLAPFGPDSPLLPGGSSGRVAFR